jgi:uncharacterized protein YqcC (DUF446 family)
MRYEQTLSKLQQLTQAMITADLWSLKAPSAEAMASTMPFACDLMPFEHWLQFMFLPRMHRLIDTRQPLPDKIALTPMAQHLWQHNAKYHALISVLNELDTLLNVSE